MNLRKWHAIWRALLATSVAGMLLVGCAKKSPPPEQVLAEWMEKTNQAIKDPARAEHIRTMVAQFLKSQQAEAAALQATAAQLATLNAEYHATNDQLMGTYLEYEAKQREALMKFKEDFFALRAELSEAEWEAIAD